MKSTDQSSDRFDIDAMSGIIRTADVFNREAQIGVTDYGVTVKAEDQGSSTLAGFCTFRCTFFTLSFAQFISIKCVKIVYS